MRTTSRTKGLVLAGAAAIALAATVFVLVPPPAHDARGATNGVRGGASDAGVVGPDAAAIELAHGTTAVDPAVAAAPSSAAGSERTALGEAYDGRAWSDVVVAIDAATGRAIDGATVEWLDDDDRLRSAPLASPILRAQIGEDALVGLDAPGRCVRPLPNDLLAKGPFPVRVALAPAAELRIVLEGAGGARPTEGATLRVYGGFGALWVWEHVDDAGIFGFEAGVYAACEDKLVGMLQSGRRRDSARVLAREARTMLAALRPARLDRTPQGERAFDVEFDASSGTVLVLDDLSPGTPYDVTSYGTAPVVTLRGGVSLPGVPDSPLDLAAGEIRTVTLRELETARVRGSLPESGHYDVLLTGRSAHGTYFDTNVTSSSRKFEFEGLTAGSYAVHASWRTDDTTCYGVREFALAAGDDVDLGELAMLGGSTLRIVPRVEVDGEPYDPERHTGIERVQFEVDVAPSDDLDDGRKSIQRSCRTLDPAEFAGLPPGAYRISIVDARIVGAAARTYVPRRWSYVRSIEMDGDREVEAVLRIETDASYDVVPTIGEREEDVVREFEALALLESGIRRESSRWTSRFGIVEKTEMRLDGPRHIVVVAHDRRGGYDESAIVASWCGRVEFDPERHDGREIEVPMTRAATVTVRTSAFGDGARLRRALRAVPTGGDDGASSLWTARIDGEAYTFLGLLPDTEYAVRGTDVVFRTGAAGSTTSVE
ncbi:MAG: hypothetical protein R3F34_04090 [Planctomycetota bacterium]